MMQKIIISVFLLFVTVMQLNSIRIRSTDIRNLTGVPLRIAYTYGGRLPFNYQDVPVGGYNGYTGKSIKLPDGLCIDRIYWVTQEQGKEKKIYIGGAICPGSARTAAALAVTVGMLPVAELPTAIIFHPTKGMLKERSLQENVCLVTTKIGTISAIPCFVK